ncbi:hypothetical protein DFAR_2000005 [Desulfarculales bacterium]
MTRMRARKDQEASTTPLMDIAATAAWSALQKPTVADLARQGVCVVNLGNIHRVLGIYEHHTGCVELFTKGMLSDAEVFDNQGHGS